MEETSLQRVTFEQAQRLKAAGFNLEVRDKYMKPDGEEQPELEVDVWAQDWNKFVYSAYEIPTYSAPTVALALKWARDVKALNGSLRFCRMEKFPWFFEFSAIRGARATCEEVESLLLDAVLNEIEKEAKK